MTLRDAFKHQIETTRLLVEDDLVPDSVVNPVVWNGVIFRPNGNFYSNGREMQVGDKLLICYVVKTEDMPTPLLVEESDIDSYEDQFSVVRLADNVPVLQQRC